VSESKFSKDQEFQLPFVAHSLLFSGPAPSVETVEGTYPIMVTQASGKKVAVVQAYAYTKYLGSLNLEFNGQGDLVNLDGTPILLNGSFPSDPDVLQVLEKYRPGIIALETEIVGKTQVQLNGTCRRQECNMANLISDAFIDWRAMTQYTSTFWTDAAIALIQGGGVRASIALANNGGNISKEDASTVLPFQNKMQIVEVTGSDLKAALEHSVNRYEDGQNRGEFMQYSGVQVVYDISRPNGTRVVEVKVRCADCATPAMVNLDLAKKYRIVMQDFLANGGDGYRMFIGKSILKTEDYDLDVFVDFLKKKSPITSAIAPLEGRVTITNYVPPTTTTITPP
jgi:5'-nucleotidase